MTAIGRRQFLAGAAGLATARSEPSERREPSGDSGAAGVRELSVLSFNILAGGARRGPLERCADLVEATGADLVGLQEATGESGARLAEMTGFQRFERGPVQILSRYPLGEASAGRLGVEVEVPGTAGVWMFNIHFRPAPYQPYQLAGIPYGGAPFIDNAAQADAEARRARGDQVDALLADMAPALASGRPVLLTGDFNEPSHLDWTGRAAGGGCCQLEVRWPASERVIDAGMTDLYRAAFPDEVARRGHTWTPTPAVRDVPDRIDFVYANPAATPVSAAVVGESAQNADIVIDPYPSDHRAVLAKVALEV